MMFSFALTIVIFQGKAVLVSFSPVRRKRSSEIAGFTALKEECIWKPKRKEFSKIALLTVIPDLVFSLDLVIRPQ